MGFRGLMTNSYIIRSRRKDEALRDGIHKLLDFNGVLMTDSGGYQVLEYGDLEIGYEEIASFQADIGSDLAVTLDRPTGYPQSRRAAEDSVDYSLRNAVLTMREYGDRETVWMGPVQGGLYLDLISKSAATLWKAGFEFLALGSPVQIMENYMFADLLKMIVAARRAVPYSVPLHLFGAGHPLTMALAVALGCDTFDSASYALFARNGRYMSHGGVLSLEKMKYLPCSCPVCARTSVRDLLDLDVREIVKLVAAHNLFMLKEEVEACKEAIAEGRLWDLVEEKSMAHPKLRDAFLDFSKRSNLLVDGTSPMKDRGLMLRSTEDLKRPELVLAGKRLEGILKRTSREAVLLASWDSVPVGKKRRGSASSPGKSDTYKIHPALGVYPVELDFVYPFTQFVTAAGIEDRMSVKEAVARLRRLGYRSVKVSKAKARRRNRSRRLTNKRNRLGASPSPRSASPRPRSPRRP